MGDYELITVACAPDSDDPEIKIIDEHAPVEALGDAWFDEFDETLAIAAVELEMPRRRAFPLAWLFGAAIVLTAAACVGATAI